MAPALTDGGKLKGEGSLQRGRYLKAPRGLDKGTRGRLDLAG